MRVGALALLLLALPASVAAQGAPEEEVSYRVLVAQALEEFEGRRWAEARALFRRAHAVEPNARTLRGIGMTSFELREYASALRAFEASLADTRRPLTDEQRAHVQGLRERARAFVARYELVLSPEPAELSVDGSPTPANDPLVLDLGEHTLRVTAEGHEPWTRTVRVEGGERERLEVQLARVAPLAEPAPREVAAPVPRDDTVAHVLLVAAALTTVASAAPIAYWVDREVAVGQCDVGACLNLDVLREQRDLGAGLSAATLTVAAGLAVVGLVLLLQPRDEPAQACRGLTCRF